MASDLGRSLGETAADRGLGVAGSVFGIGIPLMGTLERVALDAIVGGLAGVGFAAMFAQAVRLAFPWCGCASFRPSAVLLVAVLPVIGLTMLLQAVGSDFAHPAHAETAVYLGIALLGRRSEARTVLL